MNVHVWAPAFTRFGGGIGAFSRELATALRDLGHEVCLLGKFDSRGICAGLPLDGTGAVMSKLQTPAFAAKLLLAHALQHPDRLFSTHVNFAPVGHWVKRLFGTKYSVVAHGIDVHEAMPAMRRAALKAADQVIAVSNWTRQRVIACGVDAARVHVLPNTVDEQRYALGEPSRALMERYGLAAEDKVVLTVARLDKREGYKGCDRLIHALPKIAAAFPKVRLLIVGDGTDRPRLERLAYDLRVSQTVTFCGFVADDKLPQHYKLATAFALPSTGEGFGIVFLEALACGTPVLAGNRDGSVDALGNGELGFLVDPLDADAIAYGLIALLARRAPAWWFDRSALRAGALERFGRKAFRCKLDTIIRAGETV